MAKMDKISWPLVALAAITLGTVIVLANMGLEIAAIGTVVASLLAILITQQVSSKETLGVVQTNTNGTNQKLVDAILRREESRDARDSARDKLMYEMLLALPPGTTLPTLEVTRRDSDSDFQGSVR